MALYVALGLCAFLAGTLVYRYDLYEREPWYMLLLTLLLGALGMRLAAILEPWSLARVSSNAAVSAVAAGHEEAIRLAVVVGLARLFPRQFGDPMDGIVYGSIAGLGMALEESVYLLGLRQSPDVTLLPVEAVRLLGHLIMGGIVGYGIGLARADVSGWKRKLWRCWLVAFGLHFVWDWIALGAENGASLSIAQTAGAVGTMLFGMLFYGTLVVTGSRLSRRMLAPESSDRLWGWPFTAFMRSSSGSTPRNES